MNFVGHIHIAEVCLQRHDYPMVEPVTEGQAANGPTERRAPSSPGSPDGPPARLRYLLGTALPDFAAIGRFQISGRPHDPMVGTGIKVHHATDNAFHGNDWFVANCKTLHHRLHRRGINRGAARACGHVGVELLIDGHLLARSKSLADQAQRVLQATSDWGLGLHKLVENSHAEAWERHLHRIASWSVPDDYHRPRAVAERLHRILSHRPRLAFERDQIERVAEALAEISKPVIDGIDDMVDAVADEIISELG